MNIEYRPIQQIRPYEKNPRRNDAAVAAVVRSMQEFGFRQPIVVDAEGVVIAGHTRLKAAQSIGLTEVPVHVATDLTPAQVKAYRIADNATSSLSVWDADLLLWELTNLQALDFDLDTLGFDPAELSRWLGEEQNAGLCDPEDVPPVPADPVTKRGDLYLLGNHRLLCGDSTVPSNVQRLLDGATPFLMTTDPPYGVAYEPSWRNEAGLADTRRTGTVANDDRADWTQAYKLFPGTVAYVWHAARFTSDVAQHLASCGLGVRAQLIWRKERFAISRGHYHWQHEPCWYAVREGCSAKWCGDRTQSTVWDISGKDQDQETVHGTQKPLECMARPIRNHGAQDDSVYDPFTGSGTTLIACERLKRRCYAMELDPAYCDVIVARWERFTGNKAQRITAEAPTTPDEKTPAAVTGVEDKRKGGKKRCA